MTDGFDVAVMVPTNQPWDFESETSRLIRAALRAAGFPVRLLVIENGIAGARPGLEVFPGLGEILRIEHGNKSAALNAGLDLLARETLIVFFDDDVLIPKGILGAYASSARRLGPGHYFGGPTTARLEAPPCKAVARYLPNSARGLSYGTAPRTGSDFFLGFNWAVFSSDIKAAGGFDARFGPGSSLGATGQESDAQRRLRARGARSVYIPDCLVAHRVPPERCSEPFILGRAAKTGIELGLTSREYPLAAAARVPLRFLRHCLGLLAAVLRPGEFGLAVSYRANFWRGFLRGIAHDR